jgi:hypothetical protein
LTLLLLGLAGCGTPRYDVEYDYDTRASFGGLRRYQWIEDAGSASGRPRVDAILRDALDRNLERMGMDRVDSEPDFLVACTLATRREVGSRTTETRSDFDERYGSRGYDFDAVAQGEVQVVDYVEGTLTVEIFGPDGRRPIWRGWARGAIPDGRSEAYIQGESMELMRRILEKFPPPATRRKN